MEDDTDTDVSGALEIAIWACAIKATKGDVKAGDTTEAV